MKYKYYLHISRLIFFLLLSHFTYAQDTVVDLSQIQAFGIQSNKVQINNIIVKIIVADPLIPGNTQEVILPYHLPFKACLFEDKLHLIPLLEAEEPDCYVEGIDFTQSSGFARDSESIQLNHFKRRDIIEHSIFRLEPNTYHLIQNDEQTTAPTQINISLKWNDISADLDAHLLTPIASHSPERFHLYFAEKTNDIAILNNGINPFERQEEIITIFPPHIESPLLRPGIYTYVVHYFSGIGNMLDSGAVVSLQLGNQPEQLFTPPPLPQPNDVTQLFDNFEDKSMENWVVFELYVADDGMVTVVPIQNYNGIIF